MKPARPDFRFRRLHASLRWPRDRRWLWGPIDRTPQTWLLEHRILNGRRPLAEGGREGPRRQETQGSPAPPRLAGGADRERALRGAALGGRGQDYLPHPLEACSQAGLPGAAGRSALQGKGAGAGGHQPGLGGLWMSTAPAPCEHQVIDALGDLGPLAWPLASVVSSVLRRWRPSDTLLNQKDRDNMTCTVPIFQGGPLPHLCIGKLEATDENCLNFPPPHPRLRSLGTCSELPNTSPSQELTLRGCTPFLHSSLPSSTPAPSHHISTPESSCRQ